MKHFTIIRYRQEQMRWKRLYLTPWRKCWSSRGRYPQIRKNGSRSFKIPSRFSSTTISSVSLRKQRGRWNIITKSCFQLLSWDLDTIFQKSWKVIFLGWWGGKGVYQHDPNLLPPARFCNKANKIPLHWVHFSFGLTIFASFRYFHLFW